VVYGCIGILLNCNIRHHEYDSQIAKYAKSSILSGPILGLWYTIQVLRPSYWPVPESHTSNFANLTCILLPDLSGTRNLDRVEHVLLLPSYFLVRDSGTSKLDGELVSCTIGQMFKQGRRFQGRQFVKLQGDSRFNLSLGCLSFASPCNAYQRTKIDATRSILRTYNAAKCNCSHSSATNPTGVLTALPEILQLVLRGCRWHQLVQAANYGRWVRLKLPPTLPSP